MVEFMESFDPATGELVGRVPLTPVEEIPKVVARAREAQPGWHALGLEGRAAALSPVGEALLARAEELAPLLTRDTPWVGARESGYGFHHSRDGHRNFTQPRVVSVAI